MSCKSCKFWHKHGPDEGRNDRCLKTDFGWGTCSIAESSSGEPDHTEATAYALDFECVRAELYTSPEHHCSMHKEAEV